MVDHSSLETEPPESSSTVPAVRLRNITKRFGAVTACDNVDLDLQRGRIHGVLGENGAGKSTLMKMLIGLVLPDAGSIEVDGVQSRITKPTHAAALGIGMVHQHLSLVEPLTVWENVALGEPGRLHPDRIRNRIAEISEHYGLVIDPNARVADLPAGLKQRVEIIKCLRRDPSILIFDEPTSVLTPAESEELFGSLRNVVAEEGRAVALVSHKLDEILQATDDVTIMRAGRVVERVRTSDATAKMLARAMVGRDVVLRTADGSVADGTVEQAATTAPLSTHAVLRISSATKGRRFGRPMLDDLNLEVHAGEVLGVAGVEGNGQSELCDLLSSLVSLDAGTVEVQGTEVPTGVPGGMARAGISVIPADRHDSGVVLDMSVAENLIMVNPGIVAGRAVLDRAQMLEHAHQMIEDFDIMCTGPDAPLWSLSGGNQQRVVLARELSNQPTVLVAAQPTRGLDVGAIEYMSSRLRQAANDGVGVVLISSELEEILDLATRIVVLSEGAVIGEMSRDHVDREKLGLLMGGHAT